MRSDPYHVNGVWERVQIHGYSKKRGTPIVSRRVLTGIGCPLLSDAKLLILRQTRKALRTVNTGRKPDMSNRLKDIGRGRNRAAFAFGTAP